MPRKISQKNYAKLSDCAKIFNPEIFDEYFKKINELNVLVIGDTIVDEYVYCKFVNHSPAESVDVYEYERNELMGGGIIAIANHISQFCEKTKLTTSLGLEDEHNILINGFLNRNIKKQYFYYKGYTVLKRRFIRADVNIKVFKIDYLSRDDSLLIYNQKGICGYLEKELKNYDIVVVGDFGHGFLSGDFIDLICEKSKFLAVNVQTNPTNFGNNLITKYKRADYISVNEHELYLAAGKVYPIDSILEISKKLKCEKIAITLGKNGCIFFDGKKQEIFKTPVLTGNIVDTVGAGDAFFAVTSLFSAVYAPANLIGFLGNCVGALAVKTVCNNSAVTKNALKEEIKRVLESMADDSK